MKSNLKIHNRGFSLVELMIAVVIGLILIGAVLSVYIAQFQLSVTSASQGGMQSGENAISALLTPIIRSSGFSGCNTLTQSSIPGLTAGGPPPLSTLATNASFVMGYDAVGTAGGGTSYTIPQDNAVNDGSATDWLPILDPTLAGGVQKGSDVLVVLGAVPEVSTVGVVSIPDGSTTMTLQSAAGLSVGQYGVVTDCLKSNVFQITAVGGNVISHAAGGGVLNNAANALPLSYPVGAQCIPVQQTAFYVAQGQSNTGVGQSNLVSAIYTNGAWTVQPLVPGVDSMQVLYGIGTGGVISQYVPAGAVANWANVYAIRLGFLIEGQLGSAKITTSSNLYTVLGTTITVPNDGRLRHVYVMTINLRNSI